MHTHEFCYWLQGYFELRDNSNSFTSKQLECISKHLKLVIEVDKSKTGAFIHWMDGLLSMAIDIKTDDLAATTELIKAKLHECFQHDIDNKYDNKDVLDKIHDVQKHKPHWDPFTPIRC